MSIMGMGDFPAVAFSILYFAYFIKLNSKTCIYSQYFLPVIRPTGLTDALSDKYKLQIWLKQYVLLII